MSVNAQRGLLQYIGLALAPLRAAAQSEFHLRELVGMIGWDLDRITGFPADELANQLAEFVEGTDALLARVERGPETLPELVEALDAAAQAFAAVRELSGLLATENRPPEFEEFGRDLIEVVTLTYLQLSRPVLYHLAVLLTLIEPPDNRALRPAVFDGSGNLVRFPHTRARLRLDRLDDLIEDPAAALAAEYVGPNGLATSADARRTADRLFPRLAALITALGGNAVYGVKPRYGIDLGDPDGLAGEMLTCWVSPGTSEVSVGASLSLSPAEKGDLGLVVSPFGAAELTESFDNWTLTIGLTAGVEALAVGRHGVKLLLAPGSGAAGFAAQASAVRLSEAQKNPALVGSTTGTRLELPHVGLLGAVALSDSERELRLTLDVPSAAIVIAPADGDGFLNEILPPEGLRSNFDLGVEWSNRSGLTFRGSAGLESEFPVRVSLGPLSVESVYLAIRAAQDRIGVIVAVSVSVQLGPVRALVGRTGLEATVAFPEDGGNLGAADLSIGFKPPDEIGLHIDAEVVTGGGFLRYDPATGRYSGFLELQAGQLGIAAVGILDTRLPGGAPGYSLLVALRATFPAIQIGFGFALTSVGGLLALNRRVDVDALRARLATGTAGRILAPEDPIRNAPALLADLDVAFPVAPGVTVVGPTVQLVWAELVRFDIGVFIELPGPSRIVLLGSARAAIESGGRVYLVIRVDIVGVVDLQRRTAAFDAVLIDSQLLEILDLTGGAAFRLSWGDQPYAVLTLGGFHPAYNPEPLVFPSSLTRLAMVRGHPEDRLYLRFEGYFAVTSNTLQLGAAVEAVINAGDFHIQGILAFDAVIRFEPFHFEVEIRASVRVRYKSRNLGGLTLTGSLVGPGPVVVRAKVCIELLFFDICFSDTFTLGSPIPPPVTTIASALDVLVAELDNPSTLRASGTTDRYVTLRPPLEGDSRPVLSPVGRLLWVQRQAPLGLLLQRIGGTPLGSPQQVDVTSPDGDGAELDWFAPGSFAELTDDQALTRRGFERLAGGLRFGAAGVTDGPAREKAVRIRQIRLPAKQEAPLRPAAAFPDWIVAAVTRAQGGPADSGPVTPLVSVGEETWSVTDTATGATSTGLSAAQAHQLSNLAPTAARHVATPASDRVPELVF